jgi:Domain of unknown function (DUF5658)
MYSAMSLSRIVLLLFLAAQCFDGLFTYAAIHAYGPHAEGNVLIATWITLVGPAPALFGAKTVASACGVLLYLRGMHRTLSLLTVVYGIGAIVPWLVVFTR